MLKLGYILFCMATVGLVGANIFLGVDPFTSAEQDKITPGGRQPGGFRTYIWHSGYQGGK